jgi:hypothetical protein
MMAKSKRGRRIRHIAGQSGPSRKGASLNRFCKKNKLKAAYSVIRFNFFLAVRRHHSVASFNIDIIR